MDELRQQSIAEGLAEGRVRGKLSMKITMNPLYFYIAQSPWSFSNDLRAFILHHIRHFSCLAIIIWQ